MGTFDLLEGIHFTDKLWIIALPALFMATDILMGLIHAWVSQTFQSAKMRAGLGKKFGEMAYIVIGVAVTYAMGIPTYILIGITVYIIFMEFMSIMENCEKLGAPVPKFVKNVINNVNESLQADDYGKLKKKLQDSQISEIVHSREQ